MPCRVYHAQIPAQAGQGDYQTSSGYRLHWIRSTQKAEQDAETRTRRMERALDALRSIQAKLNTYQLKTRKQICGKRRLTMALDVITAMRYAGRHDPELSRQTDGTHLPA